MIVKIINGAQANIGVTCLKDETMLPHIAVTSEANATVTATNGDTTITLDEVSSGLFEADIPAFGTWTISSDVSEEVVSTTVNIASIQLYTLTLMHFWATIEVEYPTGAECVLSATGIESQTATQSPYTFTVTEAATYTVSVTHRETTRTETVVITETEQEEEVSFLVTGSTATPVNDISTWLDCACLWDKDYTTLAEVIADSEALLALISNENAVDYMARSIRFSGIGVPVMTSNTEPYGECFTNGTEHSQYFIYYAFSKAASGGSITETTGRMIGYDFGKVETVKRASFTPNYARAGITGVVEIIASNNKSDWTVLKEVNVSQNTSYTVTIDQPGSYRYYAFRGKSATGGVQFGIQYGQFYLDSICTDPLAMLYISQYNYCADALLANDIWLNELASSEYFDILFDKSVPVMSGDTDPIGEVIYSSQRTDSGGYGYAVNLFGGLKYWQSQSKTGWVGYKFAEPVELAYATFITDAVVNETITVQGSKDNGVTWVNLTDAASYGETGIVRYTVPFTQNIDSYTHYRLNITENTDTYAVLRPKVNFLGRTSRLSTPDRELKTFAVATDEEITEMVLKADRGEIDLYEDAGWRVGQEHFTSISKISSNGVRANSGQDVRVYTVGETQPAQSATLVLMHKGLYELVSPVLNTSKQSRNTCSFITGLKDCLDTQGYMNSTNTTTGSWDSCKRRAWCNYGFRKALPPCLRAVFKQFKTKTATEYNASTVATSNDYFALAAEKEILGTRAYSNATEAAALTQFTWYATAANRIKTLNGIDNFYWERSVDSTNGTFFSAIGATGTSAHGTASGTGGISPFGCL